MLFRQFGPPRCSVHEMMFCHAARVLVRVRVVLGRVLAAFLGRVCSRNGEVAVLAAAADLVLHQTSNFQLLDADVLSFGGNGSYQR